MRSLSEVYDLLGRLPEDAPTIHIDVSLQSNLVHCHSRKNQIFVDYWEYHPGNTGASHISGISLDSVYSMILSLIDPKQPVDISGIVSGMESVSDSND